MIPSNPPSNLGHFAMMYTLPHCHIGLSSLVVIFIVISANVNLVLRKYCQAICDLDCWVKSAFFVIFPVRRINRIFRKHQSERA